MRKQLAQRIADPIVAELKTSAERVVAIGELADEETEEVMSIEIAVLSGHDDDFFGEAIELRVDAAIRRLLDGTIVEDEHDDDMPRRFIDCRYDMPVCIFVCSDIDTFADVASWE